MKNRFLRVVATLALVASYPLSTPGATNGLGDFVTFPACGVRLRQPDGFTKADRFEGFADPGNQASVMVVCLEGPFAAVTAGFTAEAMGARGWTLGSRQEIEVDGQSGLLVAFEQPAGGTVYSKWVLAFGTDRTTTLVTATCPRGIAEKLSPRLTAALLSTRIRTEAAVPGLGTELPWALEPSHKLVRTPGVSSSLIYTKDGVMPLRSPGDPLFLLAPAFREVAVGDRRQYAEQRLRATADTSGLTVTSTEPVTIAGLSGYESLAEAEETRSKTPIVVYQVMLFEGDSYVLMQGLVGAELRDEYLPEFRSTSRTLRQRP